MTDIQQKESLKRTHGKDEDEDATPSKRLEVNPNSAIDDEFDKTIVFGDKSTCDFTIIKDNASGKSTRFLLHRYELMRNQWTAIA